MQIKVKLLKDDLEVANEVVENLAKEKNSIEFYLLDTLTKLDLDKEELKRIDDDYEFTLDIKNKLCTIALKKEDLVFDIKVDGCNLEVLQDKIILEYMIESDDAKCKIIIDRK